MLGHFLVCPDPLTRLCSLVGTNAFFFFFSCQAAIFTSYYKCFSCHGKSKPPCSLLPELDFSKGFFTGVICYFLTCYNRCFSLLFLREERAAYC